MLNNPGSTTVDLERQENSGFCCLHGKACHSELSNQHLTLICLDCFIAVQSLSCHQLFMTPWTAACQASLSFTTSWSLLKFMSIELVMPSNYLVFCYLLLLLPSISLHSKGLSRVFSNTTVQKHQFIIAQHSLWSQAHIHT